MWDAMCSLPEQAQEEAEAGIQKAKEEKEFEELDEWVDTFSRDHFFHTGTSEEDERPEEDDWGEESPDIGREEAVEEHQQWQAPLEGVMEGGEEQYEQIGTPEEQGQAPWAPMMEAGGGEEKRAGSHDTERKEQRGQ